MSDIIDSIYQAAFHPEQWASVLHQVACAVGAEGALLANVSNSALPWFASPGVAELYQEFFSAGWAYENAKTQALLRIPHHGFISDAEYFNDSWMAQQAIYRDFLWPRGFGYAAGTLIEDPRGIAIGVSVEYRKSSGPASKAGLCYLDTLRPHLARATILAHQLEFAKVEAALEALELANIPAATLAIDGTLIGANRAFQTFGENITITGRDRLVFSNSGANEFYRSLSIGRRPAVTGRSFALKATETSRAAILHVLPITGVAREFFLRASSFLLITPVERTGVPSARLLRGLFDLTATEARVAEKLAHGQVIAQIAASEGSQIETIRSHVKSILCKSGLKGQREFVATVASIHSVHKD